MIALSSSICTMLSKQRYFYPWNVKQQQQHHLKKKKYKSDFYFVMDYIGGGDLYYHLKVHKKFSERAVQFITAELVIALSYLHSRGIIYR